jgi:hypothetical protein
VSAKGPESCYTGNPYSRLNMVGGRWWCRVAGNARQWDWDLGMVHYEYRRLELVNLIVVEGQAIDGLPRDYRLHSNCTYLHKYLLTYLPYDLGTDVSAFHIYSTYD